MDRESFARELLKCLTENDKMVSEKNTAKGWYEVFECFLNYSYDSLLFSYPQVNEKGVFALLDEITSFLLKEPNKDSDELFPNYFIVTSDLIQVIQYCIDKYGNEYWKRPVENNIHQNYDKHLLIYYLIYTF